MDEQEIIGGLVAEGWEVVPDSGFVGLVGPFLRRAEAEGPAFAFQTFERHHNLRGVLQGGALMTFADRSMGYTAREISKATRMATVQLNVQFIDAVAIGELVETRPAVSRVTRHLTFLTASFLVGDRIVATASGVWKRLAER